jgi:hypothetical protein
MTMEHGFATENRRQNVMRKTRLYTTCIERHIKPTVLYKPIICSIYRSIRKEHGSIVLPSDTVMVRHIKPNI